MTQRKWTAADLPAMTGRTVVVTGASSGLGLVTARELATAGARVILAVRDEARGHKAAAAMPGTSEVRPLDLSSLASVRAFAATWTGPLHILINNAGIMQVPPGRTADGFEIQVGTNHLGPFALTSLLMPHITDRVVTVSSEMHKRGHIDPEDLNGQRRPYDAFQVYCDTKLANLLFTFELQHRLTRAGSSVRSMAAHPGISKTNLASHVTGLKGLGLKLLASFAQDADHGALPTLYAATAELPGAAMPGPTGQANAAATPRSSSPARPPRTAHSPAGYGTHHPSSPAPASTYSLFVKNLFLTNMFVKV
jgi:NAD(P)-dependent dehydrogenase (short-subunit alcohol dehydrogenase family)